MSDIIRIQMMGNFTIYINERQEDHMVNKSRKGLALMQYLVMNRDKPVTNRRLLGTFWGDERVINPENALKTLISRMRTLLNQVSPHLGQCIVAERGAYRWKCLPGMTIDVYELWDCFARLEKIRDDDEKGRRSLYKRVQQLYTGDLLKNSEMNEWALPLAAQLHNQYMVAVRSYIEMIKVHDENQEIIPVCRRALEIDPFDDWIHIELMNALLKEHNIAEAKAQYEEVMYLHYHYLNVEPSKELKEFYSQIIAANNSIDFSLESICRELRDGYDDQNAFVCEYPVFKEIFNIQIRNIERLGSSMFLAIVMVSKPDGQPMDNIKQHKVIRDMVEILRDNLRKGDIITVFSPTMIALLLPAVDYASGDMVMDRIKQKFYQKYPNSNVLFSYRMAPLSSNMGRVDQPDRTGNETETKKNIRKRRNGSKWEK